jgi:hypothetical protein
LSESSGGFDPIILQSTSPSHLSSELNRSPWYNTDCCSWAKVTRTEEIQLRNAAWYQPGLSREIVNELLSATSTSYQHLPYGTFLVLSSLTHPDSFALSIKVPSSESRHTGDSSIAHYLIIASLSHGYRINGSAKSFPTLYSLIVHHSVMKEILPCTLHLSVVASGIRLCEKQRFPNLSGNSDSDITKEELNCNLTPEDIDIVPKDSKDISDANYPDLLCTLRKALLASSFSEEKNSLIALP